MLAKIHTFGLNGLDAYPVTIEIDITFGLPSTTIVGLPDNAIRESKERVRSALKNSGFTYPADRITINLSPADTKKEGPAFDLAIALGLLVASEQISPVMIRDIVPMGELSLDGHVRPIIGTLPIAMASQQQQMRYLVLPKNNVSEATICDGIDILAAETLNQTIQMLQQPHDYIIEKTSSPMQNNALTTVDFCDVKGQYHVKRALEIAAAGGHNALMIGPPGSGKTMMAKRFPSIMPDMTIEEALEVTKIHSIMGLMEPGTGLIQQRPFRAPHHTSSDIALIGGGSNPRPGEVTLAHHGVLFLDELPEFRRNALEVLRQPLEDHVVTIARASKTLRFPARFIFLASMNPSPSGYNADKNSSPYDVAKMHKYLNKISGPLLDRIDLHIEVPALKTKHLIDAPSSEKSCEIKKRTVAARHIQHQRFNNETIFANAHMNAKHLKQYCILDQNGKILLRQAVEELGLSARAHDKILKVSRTIADLSSSNAIKEEHIAEAIQYRNLDRSWWQ